MYFELAQLGANCSGEKREWSYNPENREELLALGAEMSRYDPRLLGILVEYFSKHWREILPQRLRAYYPQMAAPQSLAVIAEFVKDAARESEVQYLMEYLQKGLEKVPYQLYFKALLPPAGPLSRRSAEESLRQYKKWGFLSREAPTVDVFQKKTVEAWDADARLNVLRRLFQSKEELSVGEYLKALSGSLSRQQAIKDLAVLARLKKGRKGRGARWVLRKRP